MARVRGVAPWPWLLAFAVGCAAEAPMDPAVACRDVRAAVCERARSCRQESPAWVETCLASAASLYGTCVEDVKSQGCAQVDGSELEMCAAKATATACGFYTAKAKYGFQYPLCVVHCPAGP